MIRPHSRIKDNLIISFIILYTSLLDIITQTPISLIPLLPLHFVIPLSGGIYWPSPSSNPNPFTPLSHPILSSYCLTLSLSHLSYPRLSFLLPLPLTPVSHTIILHHVPYFLIPLTPLLLPNTIAPLQSPHLLPYSHIPVFHPS